jgi:type II secretory pathway predicted ATPase ExeA
MFESHFGLATAPFRLSPDPEFYFGSRSHSQALAALATGMGQGEGFLLLTGEVGAGKTMVARTLLHSLDAAAVAAVEVVHTLSEPTDLLASIAIACGLPVPPQAHAQLPALLEGAFTAVAAEGRRTLLLVDEAHRLGDREIEALRLLSNLQIGGHALLQIVLSGQTELRSRLKSVAMLPLRQRILASPHLGPLTAVETPAYIHHRLQVAGWNGKPLFDAQGVARIHACTGGNPRRIHLLCNRLLLSAFATSKPRLAPSA